MTNTQTQFNRDIALFMGWENLEIGYTGEDIKFYHGDFSLAKNMKPISSFNYHSSLDALLPVLQKIAAIDYEKATDNLTDQTFIIKAQTTVMNMRLLADIETNYAFAGAFCQWYNEITKEK